MRIVVAAVTHKEYDMPSDPLYMPLMAGSALMKDVPGGYVRDDTGDNISSSNRTYCELTGLYWAWKNLDADCIGICHYRRLFGVRRSVFRGRDTKMMTLPDAEKLLDTVGVVLPCRRHYLIETNHSQYIHAHHAQDLDITREIIRERYPVYIRAYDRRMKMRSGHRFNMFIMRKEILGSYCSWLFDILFELERRLDISGYTQNDRRVFGYVGERLLDVWLDANDYRYAEVPYVMTEREHLAGKAAGLVIRKVKASELTQRLRTVRLRRRGKK